MKRATDTITPSSAANPLAPRLLPWYDSVKRPLPWRDRESNAYAVWISEIMLQQTTVAAVIPYYLRWLDTLPDLASVANASIDTVLILWAGLGYYSRARNIKRAAEIVIERFDGNLPRTAHELMSLPGIGRYTAGAISSIAFGAREAVVDGNVARVYSRLYALSADIDTTGGMGEMWKVAERELPETRCGDYNQAVMELGATVCLPGAPKCALCPFRSECRAFLLGVPGLYPVRSKQTRWVDIEDCAVAIENDGRLLVLKRPETGVWAGLWELPRASRQEEEPYSECAARAVFQRAGVVIRDIAEFGSVKHTVMNRRITLRGYVAHIDHGAKGSLIDGEWVALANIGALAMASPQQRLVELYTQQSKQPTLTL